MQSPTGQKIDGSLYSIATRRISKRVYFTVTSVLVGLAGKYGGWAALVVFVLATASYERGRRLVSLEFVDAIKDLEDALNIPHKYKSYDFIYDINEGKNDSWIRSMEIIPPASSMIAIKTLKFGARGQGVQQVTKVEDLHIHARASKGVAYVLPTGQTETQQLRGTVVMSVPIRPTAGNPHPEKTRGLHISGIWPNLWAPLRSKGKDQGAVEMIHEAETLTISVIFPFACKKDGIKMERLAYPEGYPGHINLEMNKRGRWQSDWIIEDSPCFTYKFMVECEEFTHRSKTNNKKSSKVLT
jgi:hypothetical protein